MNTELYNRIELYVCMYVCIYECMYVRVHVQNQKKVTVFSVYHLHERKEERTHLYIIIFLISPGRRTLISGHAAES